MAWVPVLSSLVEGARARLDAISEMPFGLLRMNATMREMTDAVVSTTDTLDHVQRLVMRVDRLVSDLEEPLRSLAPGLTRLAKVLDDPALETLPITLHRISEDALPLVKGMRDTQARMAVIASSTDRITSLVDETGNRIAGLAAGAGGLLLGRRPPSQAGQADPGQDGAVPAALGPVVPAEFGPMPVGTADRGRHGQTGDLTLADARVSATISFDDRDEDEADEESAGTHARSA